MHIQQSCDKALNCAEQDDLIQTRIPSKVACPTQFAAIRQFRNGINTADGHAGCGSIPFVIRVPLASCKEENE